MKTAIHVGNEVSKTTADNLVDIFTTLFRVGRETQMDQGTIVEAIHAVSQISEVKQVTITNANISGDKVVNMNDVTDEE